MYRRTFYAFAYLVALSGCLDEVHDQPPFPPMCDSNADCDTANGEVCDQGVCWGDPPANATFAATLLGPDGADDLVRTDVALTIASDGTVTGMQFADTITVSGRVTLACGPNDDPQFCDPTTSIAAQLRITRPSDLPGLPDFTRTVTASDGAVAGDVAFAVTLPRLAAGAEPYQVQIVPQASQQPNQTQGPSPQELAPPGRVEIDGTADEPDLEWVLGDPAENKIVIGRVVDAAQRGISGMQVYALGRWQDGDAPTRSSSIATTDESGVFAFRVPIDMLDLYDVLVVPPAGVIAPTLRAKDLYIPDPDVIESPDNTVMIDDLAMPSYPQGASFVLPVSGTNTAGSDVPVAGAEVRLTTTLLDQGGVTATYTATGSTDPNGEVELQLIPGGAQNRVYAVRVISPPDSSHASLDDKMLNVGPGNTGGRSVLPRVTLDSRLLVAARVLNDQGAPVAGATVNTDLSLPFRLTLPAELQSELESLKLPSATTDDNGVFTLWLDPSVIGLAAFYDLAIVPPAGAATPRWSLRDLAIDDLANQPPPGTDGSLDLWLPPPSFARGPIHAPDGSSVADAEVWLYELPADNSLCADLPLPAGQDCTVPAQLRGLWHSRKSGVVWMVLPDVDAYFAH